MPPRNASTGGQNPEFVLQEFRGMNNLDAREAINDEEFYWCENAIPVGNGALYPVPSGFLISGSVPEAGPPKYSMMYTDGVFQYLFAVFNSANGYIVKLSGNIGSITSATLILAGLAAPVAIPYNNGILIIDTTGYWDYNVTTANTLTPWNNTAAFATLNGVAGTIAGNTNLKQSITATGTGATFQATYTMTSAALTAGGAGYAVGDVIYLTDNNPTATAQLIVATIGGGGAVATFTIASGGSYPGPTSAAFVLVGPSGTVTATTGAGAGATFSTHIQATAMKILTPGHGYTGTTTVLDVFGGGPTTLDSWNIVSSGVIGGVSIATYAGRVWIASGKVVIFTDINSYNAFGGAGGSFTINDAYLIGSITALYSANNYLYIFGQTSIDALSNVTITLGVTAFSRINLTASVGTIFGTSIFSYLRSIVFFNQAGIWQLAGATPEKISEKIASIITGSVAAAVGGAGALVFGCQVMFRGELCIAIQLTYNDTITGSGAPRPIILMFFRGRWWVHSIPFVQPYFYATAMSSIPINGIHTLFVWRGGASQATLYYAFPLGNITPLATWILKTKLWDGGAPLKEKQSLNAAIAGVFSGTTGTGVTCTIDTEKASSAALNLIPNGEPTGYNLDVIAANQGNSQYLGMTITGGVEMSQIDLIALKGKADRDMLT